MSGIKIAAFRASASLVLIAAGTTAVFGQVSSSATTDIKYQFSLDPTSTALASNLIVTDQGSGPFMTYSEHTGNATASAAIDPISNFNLGTWSGESKVSASTFGVAGSQAQAMMESAETLQVTNTGAQTIVLDCSATVQLDGAISPGTVGNNVSEENFAGIQNLSPTQNSWLSIGYIHNQYSPGTFFSQSGQWVQVSGSAPTYTGSYLFDIKPTETSDLYIFADAQSQFATTPEPATFLPFLGLLGLVAHRRKFQKKPLFKAPHSTCRGNQLRSTASGDQVSIL